MQTSDLHILIANLHILIANLHILIANLHIPIANLHIPIANLHIPIANLHILIANLHIPIANLHIPIANLTTYQKSVYYQAIKIYNHLPRAIKDLSGNKNKFKPALKIHLLDNSFYSLKEYFDA
jgi:hypothetical protein